jgi:hypothetical protein
MQPYRFVDRLTEPTSYFGVLIATMGFAIPMLIPPNVWAHAAGCVHALLGAACFFWPENRFVLSVEAIAQAVAGALPNAYGQALAAGGPAAAVAFGTPAWKPMPVTGTPLPASSQSGFASLPALAGMIGLAGGLLVAAGLLSGCSQQGVQSGIATVNAGISTVAKDLLTGVQAACTDVQPIATVAQGMPQPSGSLKNLLSYEGSVCTPNGAVQPNAPVDSGTAEWIGLIKAGLQVAANLPATPAASPPSTAPAAPAASAQ